MPNPLLKLAQLALKSAVKDLAKRSTVGRAVAKAIEPAKPAIQTARKIKNTAGKVNTTINKAYDLATKEINITPRTPSVNELTKYIRKLEKEKSDYQKRISELENRIKVLETNSDGTSSVGFLNGFAEFTMSTTYSEYYNTQREKFWDARGSGRDIEAAYRVAYTWLENQLNDIETYIDMIEEYDETVQEKIKRAKEVCETVLNELEEAYTMGLDAVVKYEQSER